MRSHKRACELISANFLRLKNRLVVKLTWDQETTIKWAAPLHTKGKCLGDMLEVTTQLIGYPLPQLTHLAL